MHTPQTDLDYRRLETPKTDITRKAAYSVFAGRGVYLFGYPSETLHGLNDGTSITEFRLDLSTLYGRQNPSDNFVLNIPRTMRFIGIENDLDRVINLERKSYSLCWPFMAGEMLLNV